MLKKRRLGHWLLCATFVLALWPLPGGAAERHAGTVMSVDTATQTLTLDEFGANAVRRTLAIRLAADARLTLSERNRTASEFDRPFDDRPIGIGELRPGDYVVVEFDDQPAVATAVTVTLRGGA